MDDTKLLKRYAAGEEEAFQELMVRYRDSVYAFLRRFLSRSDLVEDVFQETFLQLFVSRDTFDVSRPLRPWLFTIAANKATINPAIEVEIAIFTTLYINNSPYFSMPRSALEKAM